MSACDTKTSGAGPTIDGVLHALAQTPSARPFRGTPRYGFVRCLGEGGFGVVYECSDRELGRNVALKLLKPRPTGFAASIRRLKSEFRSVADIVHENVVGLYELACEDDRWFIVMELVHGCDLLRFVRAGAPARSAGAQRDSAELLSVPRLRSCLRQIVAGVGAMHQSGIIHRDLKPSNVLVEPSGRVVVLDFGLAHAFEGQGADVSQVGAGTPYYMAPEQTLGTSVGPATDVYATGVILYEALTGRVPFEGGPVQVLWQKANSDPQPPSALATVPRDLEALCLRMLAREPEDRPSLEEIAARLGEADRGAAPRARKAPPALIGRRAQLDALHQAYARVSKGPHIVLLHGPAGIGKSALMSTFADELAERGNAVVIAGQCHERESVPFKGVDGLVDAFVEYLHRLPRNEAAALMPRDIHLAVQLFPVLGAVAAVHDVPAREHRSADPRQLRQEAFGALKELVGRIADKAPLVMLVDDMQWSDADSARLLSWLLAPPDPPRVLLVLSHRSEDATGVGSPVHATREALALASVPTTDLRLAPLPRGAAIELAARALQGVPDRDALIEALAARSEGHPLFIAELAREYARFGACVEQAPGLVDVLWNRVTRCSMQARALLDTIALAGRPLAPALCFEAAGLGGAGMDALRTLRSQQLVRTTETGTVTVFHDRVRDAIQAHASAEARRACHLSLAHTLERSPDPDPEALALHYDEADRRLEAGRYGVQAAERAMATFAFDRAASLYQLAIDRLETERTRGGALHEARARALSFAGSTSEAAVAYLDAAEQAEAVADHARALDLRRRGYEHSVVGGELQRGVDGLWALLADAGVRVPATRAGRLLWLAYQVTRLKLRGLRYRPTDEAEVPAQTLRRLDVLASASRSFEYTDPIAKHIFSVQLAREALAAGEPRRVAKGLIAAASVVSDGSGSSSTFDRFLGLAEELATNRRDADTLAEASVYRGLEMLCAGDWPQARQCFARATDAASRGATNTAAICRFARALALECGMFVGDYQTAYDEARVLVMDARERRDPVIEAFVRLTALVDEHLNRDDVLAAREQLQKGGFETRCMIQLIRAEAKYRVALFADEPEHAVQVWEAAWPGLVRDGWLYVPTVRVRAGFGRAMALIARGDRQSLSQVKRYGRLTRSIKTPYGAAMGAAVEASRMAAIGPAHRSAAAFLDAARRLDAIEMRPLAAGCRARAAALSGQVAARARAEDVLRGMGIANVPRWLDAWVPLPPVKREARAIPPPEPAPRSVS